MKKLILGLLIAFLMVNPAPVIPPDGVSFDPNDMPSSVMGVYEVYIDTPITGYIDIYEPEGETVTVTSDGCLVLSQEFHDANNYTYKWTYIQSVAGVYAVNVKVLDPSGNEDNRTIVFGVMKKNKPPVITGCRRGIEID